MSVIAENPILSGFYPDPTICSVGEDFYIVNSSFSYFPGLPILHSKDLKHWEQIGNALERVSQLPLEHAGHSQGLFAPTMRYSNGVYYIICTNVSFGGNFVVKATNPEGPWSEPYYIQGADGIDPSLFFDDDGRCYYIGTHPNKNGCKYNGDWYIWIQEFDVNEMVLVGEKKDVWNGAMKNIVWPEGPHLYKRGEYYYIMHAEGGTGPDHAVTVCRSKDIWGPYENCFCNPILTHRHLGVDYPIRYVGHADLVQTVHGEWYMVMLAVRPSNGYTTMGRETFLAKVTWENDWPVVNPGVGMLTDKVEIDLEEYDPCKNSDSFSSRTGRKNAIPGSNRVYAFAQMKELGDEFLSLRKPKETFSYLTEGEGLNLKLRPVMLSQEATPSYVGIRQQHHAFKCKARVNMEPLTHNRYAGVVYYQSNQYYFAVRGNREVIEVILCEKGIEQTIVKYPWIKEQTKGQPFLEFSLNIDHLTASIEVKNENNQEVYVTKNEDIHTLSTEVAGGFVGCTVGLFAESKSQIESEETVCFTSFSYEA